MIGVDHVLDPASETRLHDAKGAGSRTTWPREQEREVKAELKKPDPERAPSPPRGAPHTGAHDAGSSSDARALAPEKIGDVRLTNMANPPASGASVAPASAAPPALRVFGHRAEEGADKDIVARIRNVMADLKEERRDLKADFATDLYLQRAKFPKGFEQKDKASNPEWAALLDGNRGRGKYAQRRESLQAHVNRGSVLSALKREFGDAIRADTNEATAETTVFHGDTAVYRLYHGASAWYEPDGAADSGLRRGVIRKHGSDNEYVRDNAGIPVRRYGYAIKDRTQLEQLVTGKLVGKNFVANPNWDAFKVHDHEEKRTVGKPVGATKSPDDLVVAHQELKGHDGVATSDSAAPLVSNRFHGFASGDAGERKLKIDHARLPERPAADPNFPHLQALPGLRALAKDIPGHAPVQVGPWGNNVSADEHRRNFHASTLRNRELYLGALPIEAVVGMTRPSPLEDMSYIDERWDRERIRAEYRRARYDEVYPPPAWGEFRPAASGSSAASGSRGGGGGAASGSRGGGGGAASGSRGGGGGAASGSRGKGEDHGRGGGRGGGRGARGKGY